MESLEDVCLQKREKKFFGSVTLQNMEGIMDISELKPRYGGEDLLARNA